MDINEFAERCRVSSQMVRIWLRDGKVICEGGRWMAGEGFILSPKVSLRRGEGERRIVVGGHGVSMKTLERWQRSGRVCLDGGEMCVMEKGWCFVWTYRPVWRRSDKTDGR